GLIGFAWRRSVAGILGALILAVHPWHIRYGIDLRGYSWVVLWTATGMLWLTCLLRSGRSKWWPWWAFGVNQALLVWSFLYGAAVAAAFFGVVALLVPFVWKSQEDRWAAWFRLILVNVVAAMIFIQLFAPNLLQMTRWLDDVTQHHAGHGLNADKFIDFVGWWFAGTTWELPQIPESAGLADLASRSAPALMGTAMILIGSLVGIGLYSMGRRSRPLALILGAPLVGGAVLLAFFWVTQDFFYPRFLIFLVIPMALGLGLACDWQSTGSRYRILLAAAVLGGLCWLMNPQWGVLMSRPYAPMRDVAEVFAAESSPALFACYGHGREMLPDYAPEVREASSLAELKALAAEAKAKGVGLVVAVGYLPFNRTMIPDGFEWLDDPEHFEVIATRLGIEPDFYFRVLRWTGKS
ncbi:MAG: hypothetical protein KDL87_14065, partial [Verrucomicrobiae bacterium]|nr:hypothetical protein [Verrucomicrobiae bacterium]